jgi:hypothetical protein
MKVEEIQSTKTRLPEEGENMISQGMKRHTAKNFNQRTLFLMIPGHSQPITVSKNETEIEPMNDSLSVTSQCSDVN